MPRSKKNGDNNALLPIDAPVHDWYRFVLSYPPHLVRQYLDKFGIDQTATVLDPFSGTGTTPVECKKLGISSAGIESNYMAYFASKVKVNWDINAEAFLADSIRIAEEATDAMECSGIGGYTDLPLFSHEPVADTVLKNLTEDQWKVLSADFISPMPLHRTLTLIEIMRAGDPKPWSDHQELALAKALVSGIGNVAFGPEIGATPPKEDAPVVSLWLQECRRIYNDLTQLDPGLIHVPSQIIQGDARNLLNLEPASIDCVITSPPYPNEKDYTRTTRLETVLLGFIQDKKDLKALKQGLLRSNTRNVFVADDDDRCIADFESITSLARQIEDRRIELGKTSGFERLYHRVVLLYFGGMKRHLECLRPYLRPGARLAYVVGDQMSYFRIPIRTGQILAEIADSLGYQVDDIDLWRTRLATATKERIREEVVVLRYPATT